MKEYEEILSSSDEADPTLEKYRALQKLTGKAYAFSNDETDEFQVTRETGEIQGIFKTWALPIVPFMDTDRLSLLTSAWPSLSMTVNESSSFSQALSDLDTKNSFQPVKETLDLWNDYMKSHPAAFQKSLERARVSSSNVDRRLVEVFNERSIPTATAAYAGEIVNRLEIATILTSPFYNIEALAGDANGFEWNPIVHAQMEVVDCKAGGKLDAEALLLPAAFQDIIVADQLNWNGLQWSSFTDSIQYLSHDKERLKILQEIAGTLAVPLEHILFGLNALEFIPVRGGGKKADMSKESALEAISALSSAEPTTPEEEIIKAGRDINALIRFCNWLPLIPSQDVIDTGNNWNYASTCDVSNQLVDFVTENPNIWIDEFKQSFSQVLLPQINYLDATSAKGRFLLQLIKYEDKITPEFTQSIDNKKIQAEIIAGVIEKRQGEYSRLLGSDFQPRALVGGKIFGLEEIIQNISLEIPVPDGVVINAEWVEDFIAEDETLQSLIAKLTYQTMSSEKLLVAMEIRDRISAKDVSSEMVSRLLGDFPEQDSYVVRSSSYDEDTASGQTAAGIYESVLKVPKEALSVAIKTCISSFYSDKAVNYREMIGTDHTPTLGLLIQPYIEGIGGTVYTQDLHSDSEYVVIEASHAASDITSGSAGHTRYEINNHEFVRSLGSIELSEDDLKKLTSVADTLKNVKDRDMDIEWVKDKYGIIWLLQARVLPKARDEAISKPTDFFIASSETENLSYLFSRLQNSEGAGILYLQGTDRDLDAFQGELFGMIAQNRNKIAEIQLDQNIPMTSHFANICASLGITLRITK